LLLVWWLSNEKTTNVSSVSLTAKAANQAQLQTAKSWLGA
jgi:hypothetical protein